MLSKVGFVISHVVARDGSQSFCIPKGSLKVLAMWLVTKLVGPLYPPCSGTKKASEPLRLSLAIYAKSGPLSCLVPGQKNKPSIRVMLGRLSHEQPVQSTSSLSASSFKNILAVHTMEKEMPKLIWQKQRPESKQLLLNQGFKQTNHQPQHLHPNFSVNSRNNTGR